MKLFNLSHLDQQYLSLKPPKALPENYFSFIEIHLKNDKVIRAKGFYKYDDQMDEIVLSDIDLTNFKNINNSVDVEFVGDELDDKSKYFFIISACSYLIYYRFMKFPNIEENLLTHEKLAFVTSFSPMSILEQEWLRQTSRFHRTYANLFEKNIDNEVEKALVRINQEADKISEEVISFKRKFLKDLNKRLHQE